MSRFKGLVLLNARNFCVERFGAPGWERVLGVMTKDERTTVESAVHVGWYDIELYDSVHENIDRVLGRGDNALMVPLGRWCVEKDLTTVHRVFMRMATPSFVFAKYGDYWRRYQDSGDWQVAREGERHVRATLANWGSVSAATCVRLAAYIERFFDLLGAKGTRVSRAKCRSRGDRVCEYDIHWTAGVTT